MTICHNKCRLILYSSKVFCLSVLSETTKAFLGPNCNYFALRTCPLLLIQWWFPNFLDQLGCIHVKKLDKISLIFCNLVFSECPTMGRTSTYRPCSTPFKWVTTNEYDQTMVVSPSENQLNQWTNSINSTFSSHYYTTGVYIWGLSKKRALIF